ncbi:TIGR01620 family protein [Martelella sp. HB161492]|uniref:YcjF family protein n=1 Tax=Martelella sp. HB161492 TaxID=2720726 RepID=UPI001590C7BD|nr:TIGR01620 family protein [Martelella sp. HB161492]
MSDQKDSRRPAAFDLEGAEKKSEAAPAEPRRPQHFETPSVRLTPDEDDPFIREAMAAEQDDVVTMQKRRFTFTKLAALAFSIVLSLAIGLALDDLVRSLFERAPWLGWLALGAVVVGVAAVLVVLVREAIAIFRLGAIQHIKLRAAEAHGGAEPKKARTVVHELEALLSHKPETARGRERLKQTEDEIVDAPQLIELAERELMSPLDLKARSLIVGASKRVSVVTAVSPRAVVDLAYVAYESIRLVRAMAELYGGRPGSLGMFRLVRDVLAHLAVTGSIAVGDGLVQQVLGHGIASKLSARFGEGVINGLMTARIGIAAMDLCRPMPFRALKRPGIGDFIGDLAPGAKRDLEGRPDPGNTKS